MKVKERIKGKINSAFGKYRWYNSFKEDYGFRALVTMMGGVLINVIFAVVNGVTALKYMSLWYGVFSGYYFVLAVQRIGVVLSYRRVKKKSGGDKEKLERGKNKIYLANGAIFVPLDIALGALITVMILKQKPTVTGEIMAITSATYTTYKVVMAIRNLAKAKAAQDFLVQTIRNIGIVDALTSLMSLEVTLITTFSDEATFADMRTLIAISGLTVCVFTVGLGSFMIIKGSRTLNQKKRENKNGQKI